uniref:GH16 domain-containing protein n=1 Tax=Oryza rufipogon TaxID=4529 RepID=A0A0E0R655_ORYRU
MEKPCGWWPSGGGGATRLDAEEMVASAKAMLPSGEDKHNEFDLEFLGNVTGEPYLVQTNLYIDSVDNREQCIDMCFDPIADFHTYVVLWNPSQVVFLVDDTPIRVYKNKNATAIKVTTATPSLMAPTMPRRRHPCLCSRCRS